VILKKTTNFGYLDGYVISGIYVQIHVIWIVYVSLSVITGHYGEFV